MQLIFIGIGLANNNEKSIVAGDFNNSIIWDKKGNDNNFNNINDHFVDLGFVSNYHKLKGEDIWQRIFCDFFSYEKRVKKISY
jgi:hypothetical protein